MLITLITSISITGISLLDNHIWNLIIAFIVVLAYGIVGLFYTLHLIVGKEAGKETFLTVFVILIIVGVLIYNGILRVEQWILSWPLFVKILVPSILGCGVIATTVVLIVNRVKERNNREVTNS